MLSRSVINPKKRKGSEKREYYYKLISEANAACTRATKDNFLPEETGIVMDSFEKWLLVSSLGVFTPLLVVTYFFLKGAFIEIKEKK